MSTPHRGTDAPRKRKRHRLTKPVLDGIISATSFYLAGPPDNGVDSGPERDAEDREIEGVQRADQWAKEMRTRRYGDD